MPTTPPDPERGARALCPCHERETADQVRGWHERQGPGPLLRQRHGMAGESDLRDWLPRWTDHAYRLREDGRWRYVAEPYSLDDDALADLAWLAEQGYTVSATAWEARHSCGHTLAVRLIPSGNETGPGVAHDHD